MQSNQPVEIVLNRAQQHQPVEIALDHAEQHRLMGAYIADTTLVSQKEISFPDWLKGIVFDWVAVVEAETKAAAMRSLDSSPSYSCARR